MRRRFHLAWGLLLGLGLSGLACKKSGTDPSPAGENRGEATTDRGVSTPELETPAIEAVESVVTIPAERLLIWPSRAALHPGDAGLQLIAMRVGPDEALTDVTRSTKWVAEPDGIVEIDDRGYLVPRVSGTAVVRVEGSTEAACEITVDAQAPRAWDFAMDVVPLLTRKGCNTGGCHGKAQGQNGFHLSLFGYDPAGDYLELIREDGGRRLSRFDPPSSLLLRKATGRVPHAGGRRIAPGSAEEKLLLGWIAQGAPERSGAVHGSVTGISIEPGDIRLSEPGKVQVRVVAHYPDGHTRDVTRLALLKVNDETVASVNDEGLVGLTRRAETDLVVRYQSHVKTARLGTLINPDLEFDFSALQRVNFIDDELFRRLASLKVPPSPRSDDATFLRRVSLDLTGQQPRPEEIRAFLENSDPAKRIKLVDQLMSNKLFVDLWLIKLGDLLQVSTARFGNGRGLYEDWLKRSLIENRPWDELVRTLLTALGNPYDPRTGGPVNYALEGADAREQAELTAQRFLGLRFRCAQCHDHPFDVWTQDDYYGLAAFFAKVQRPGGVPGQMMDSRSVTVNPEGFVEHPRTRTAATPKIPGGPTPELSSDEDPRKSLADWITAPDNPYFARATANWVWGQFFGRGLVEPVDDLNASNPPVHPELLAALARDFISHGFDLRHLIRTIASSEAYGLASSTRPGNENDRRLFSHQTPRPLTAHQIADALAQATDTELRFDISRGGGGNLVTRRAVEINDPAIPSILLDTFGRCPRTSGCSPVSNPQLSLRQSLLLIGGSVIDDRISRFDGYLTSLLEFEPSPEEIVENLYLRTICRKPTAEERRLWSAELEQAPNLREACEDLFWALLNSREFAFNH